MRCLWLLCWTTRGSISTKNCKKHLTLFVWMLLIRRICERYSGAKLWRVLNVYEETVRKGRTLHLSGSTFQTHSCGSVHGWVTLLQIPPIHPVQTVYHWKKHAVHICTNGREIRGFNGLGLPWILTKSE